MATLERTGTNHDPAPPDSGAGHDWRVRFWMVFTGQTLSLIGSALTQFVLLWWITQTTGSVSALATAGTAALLPQALLGPLGGVLADRYDRRLLMIVADGISALCMVALIVLFLTDRIALWHVYAMMAARSAMQAFHAPAAAASVAMLVPDDYLVRASALNQSMQSLTLVIAPPLGALAISTMPMGWALGIDLVTAILGIAPLLVFTIPQTFAARGAHKTTFWSDFREGVAVVWHMPGLRPLYAVLGAVVLAVLPTFTLVPLLVQEHFHGGAAQVALLEGLSGIGMVLGSLVVAALTPRRKVPWILGGFVVSCFAMALTALAPTNLFGVAVAWWVISGIAFVVGNVPLTALLQSTVPNALQGRVLSLLNTLTGLAAPVGLAIVMPLGQAVGVRGIFVVAGVLGAAISAAGFLSRSLRGMDRAG
jgi:DHA3 family macrolide efflux protein-like MFS transporter